MTGGTPTVGVEEEFLLLDPATGENAPVADRVYPALPDELRGRSRVEFRPSMVEMVTGVCTGLDEVRRQLREQRAGAAAAAKGAGARLVAVGATPVAEPYRTPPGNPRFAAITRHYGPIARDPSVCGCHVHVGVPDRETAVQVCNHLRGWLPVVQAMMANSPLHEGADTGFASWRSAQLERWPCVGPWPRSASAADYDRTVAAMVASGALLDDSMALWYVKPSAAYPTVEVRIGDVCPAADDAVLVAGLVRALVGTARADIAAGRRAPVVPDELLRAAHWNAARTGLDGTLLDPSGRRSRPAWEVVDLLVARAGPALRRHGDAEIVADGLDRIRREGTGAARQRRVLAETGAVAAVLEHLAELTAA
ncbi:carboxylate-amine ligase [Paractinoplanes rishiriensis]|uniref:Putative glutamate--cysteine ligase 2 n=1 Tax=Paractinoplanes rishiriensis TaxID=1050105 RepID=A0A919JSY1_9ACTN|nr:glutamate--cysteine ligase [Actinoplanes rishiriensis]GIE94198.1 putative glutamate--cysteine ligase 2 [Actinoplanes rishiriensis]